MDKNQKSILIARLFVIAAFAITSWALIFRTGVVSTDEAGIVLHLPSHVASWQGVEIYFCPDRKCGGQYFATQLDGATVCPRCGETLGQMNWAERAMLPADTGLVRSYYARPGNTDGIHATIVLSGDDRSSIHRPQVCMTANGYEIMDERTIVIPLASREEPLEVMVMDMDRAYTDESGRTAYHTIYYAYWFVGKGRETASHVQRMAWMAIDRILYGVSHRWAYIALSGNRTVGSDAHLQTIANFASQLHPTLLTPEPPTKVSPP
ncbi:MAG: EpsI family protein [Verrucomicrobiota bacterium]|jgi:hypothetical protein|nr:EpsI family protein [Verrucomicrobiota bacterium]